MTKEEFEKAYVEGGGMSMEELAEYGLVTVKCDCGERGCEGWRMAHIVLEGIEDEDIPA